MKPEVTYAGPDEVAEIIRSGTNGRDWAIIDVRDNDFSGGNIPGAINIPSETLSVERFRELAKEMSNVNTVIFHCSLSQQRGPSAAQAFANTIALQSTQDFTGPNMFQPPERTESKSISRHDRPTIIILRGGFSRE